MSCGFSPTARAAAASCLSTGGFCEGQAARGRQPVALRHLALFVRRSEAIEPIVQALFGTGCSIMLRLHTSTGLMVLKAALMLAGVAAEQAQQYQASPAAATAVVSNCLVLVLSMGRSSLGLLAGSSCSGRAPFLVEQQSSVMLPLLNLALRAHIVDSLATACAPPEMLAGELAKWLSAASHALSRFDAAAGTQPGQWALENCSPDVDQPTKIAGHCLPGLRRWCCPGTPLAGRRERLQHHLLQPAVPARLCRSCGGLAAQQQPGNRCCAAAGAHLPGGRRCRAAAAGAAVSAAPKLELDGSERHGRCASIYSPEIKLGGTPGG